MILSELSMTDYTDTPRGCQTAGCTTGQQAMMNWQWAKVVASISLYEEKAGPADARRQRRTGLTNYQLPATSY